MSDIPKGYKQTEVGILPEEWEVDYIENIGHVTTGSKNTQDRIEDGDYPFFVRSQTIERINTYSFDGEAVLTAGDGVGTGKVFHYINGKFDVHQRVYRISDFLPGVDGHFFYLYFSKNFYNRIMQMTAKSSVDSVRRDMITRMMVPLPTIEGEQEAISQAIRDVDALLDGLDRLIAKKRDLKQAAMQGLLSPPAKTVMDNGELKMENEGSSNNSQFTTLNSPLNIRLPGFEGEWESTDIASVTDSHKQGYFTHEKYMRDGIRLVRITDLCNPHIDYQTMPYLPISKMDYEQYKVDKGDFLFARSGAIGRYGIVEDDTPAIFGSYIIRFRFNQTKLVNRFFGYLFETDFVWKQLGAITQGSSNININANNIKAINIPLPKLGEQTAIAQVLSDMDAEIEALEQRRNKTKGIKQAMMQELLTGKTRLVN